MRHKFSKFGYILGTSAILCALATPAQAQFLGGNVNNNTVFSGVTGAGAGAGIGALIAPRGNNVEGAAIGAVVGGLGGLGGAAYANQFDNRQFNRPFNRQVNPQLNRRSRYGNAGFSGQQFRDQQIIYSQPAPYGGQNIGQPVTVQDNYGQPVYAQPDYGQQIAVHPSYAARPTYAQPNSVSWGQPYSAQGGHVISQPSVVYTPAPSAQLTHAPAGLTLEGPPLPPREIHRGVTYVEPAPVIRAQRNDSLQYDNNIWQSSSYAQQSQPTHSTSQTPQHTTQHTQGASYCYPGSDKRYDSYGNLVNGSCN